MIEAVPTRLQLSRRRGFSLQAHSRAVNGLACVSVARPGRWGNPWSFGPAHGSGSWWARHEQLERWCGPFETEPLARAYAVAAFRHEMEEGVPPDLTELRGKNLACWCPLDGGPCHADVLLELANRPHA